MSIILFREKEAAAYLGGLSVKTLQAWRFHGTGPPFRKIGRLVRYTELDLQEYIAGRVRTSTHSHGPVEAG